MKHRSEIEALEFVKDAGKQISKTVTREYKILLRQFIAFRDKTWSVIDDLKDYGSRMLLAETLASQAFPVYDFRYKADPDSPFRLYNCLTPALKKHVRVPEALLTRGYAKDTSLMITYQREKKAQKIDDVLSLWG